MASSTKRGASSTSPSESSRLPDVRLSPGPSTGAPLSLPTHEEEQLAASLEAQRLSSEAPPAVPGQAQAQPTGTAPPMPAAAAAPPLPPPAPVSVPVASPPATQPQAEGPSSPGSLQRKLQQLAIEAAAKATSARPMTQLPAEAQVSKTPSAAATPTTSSAAPSRRPSTQAEEASASRRASGSGKPQVALIPTDQAIATAQAAAARAAAGGVPFPRPEGGAGREGVALRYPGRDYQEIVELPATQMSKVVGNAGHTVSVIQQLTEARLWVLIPGRAHDPHATQQLVISGTPSSVAAAKEMVLQVAEFGPAVLQRYSPSPYPTSPGPAPFLNPMALMQPGMGMMGGGMGAGGARWAGGGPGEVQAQESQLQAREEVDCPLELVGRVIGKGGETITNLQIRSGCRIYVNQDYPKDMPRKIILIGDPASVLRGKEMVKEVMEFGPPEHNRRNPYLYNVAGGSPTRPLQGPEGMMREVAAAASLARRAATAGGMGTLGSAQSAAAAQAAHAAATAAAAGLTSSTAPYASAGVYPQRGPSPTGGGVGPIGSPGPSQLGFPFAAGASPFVPGTGGSVMLDPQAMALYAAGGVPPGSVPTPFFHPGMGGGYVPPSMPLPPYNMGFAPPFQGDPSQGSFSPVMPYSFGPAGLGMSPEQQEGAGFVPYYFSWPGQPGPYGPSPAQGGPAGPGPSGGPSSSAYYTYLPPSYATPPGAFPPANLMGEMPTIYPPSSYPFQGQYLPPTSTSPRASSSSTASGPGTSTSGSSGSFAPKGRRTSPDRVQLQQVPSQPTGPSVKFNLSPLAPIVPSSATQRSSSGGGAGQGPGGGGWAAGSASTPQSASLRTLQTPGTISGGGGGPGPLQPSSLSAPFQQQQQQQQAPRRSSVIGSASLAGPSSAGHGHGHGGPSGVPQTAPPGRTASTPRQSTPLGRATPPSASWQGQEQIGGGLGAAGFGGGSGGGMYEFSRPGPEYSLGWSPEGFPIWFHPVTQEAVRADIPPSVPMMPGSSQGAPGTSVGRRGY